MLGVPLVARHANKKNKTLVAQLIVAMGSICVSPDAALAQQAEAVEEIIVTGSRIPRKDFETPSPLTTLDAMELRLSGTTNIEDSLDTLPQVVPGNNRTANNPGNGRASGNLRGLGKNRTLILVNGRRFISSGTDGAVDINNIPATLIQRAEVVTGGASAVYGSDAIAGAVNFILKDSFEGIEVNAQYDVTDQNDGQVIDIYVAGGLSFANGRGQLSGFVGYNDRESVLQGDRAHSAQTRDHDIFTGESFIGGSIRNPEGMIPNPVDIGGVPAPDGVTFNPDGTPRPFTNADLYDFGPINYLQTPLTRWSAAAFADLDAGESVHLYAELMYVDSSAASQLAPTLNPGTVEMNIDNPFLQPQTRQILIDFFDPDADGIAEFILNKRLVELGPRIIPSDSTMSRIVIGADGEFTNGWTWDAHFLYSDVDFETLFDNNASRTNLRQSQLVDPLTGECFDTSNGCVPANLFGAGNLSPEAADFIRVPAVIQTDSIQQSLFNASIVGDLPSVFSDRMQFAFGVEYRKDETEFVPDPALATNGIISLVPSPPVAGAFEMREVFAELVIPVISDRFLAKELTVEAGYRLSDHSISGNFDSWKVAGQWEPLSGLMFRASLQEAVRAPNSQELFEAEFVGDNPFLWESDLCSASFDPVALGIDDVCVAQGVPRSEIGIYEATPFFLAEIQSGGNLALDPEVSETFTAGVVIRPEWAPDLSMSLDYYSIRIDNAIQYINSLQTVIDCFSMDDPNSPLCAAVERTDPTFNITRVVEGPRNIARIETEGFDLQIEYTVDLPSWLSMFNGASDLRIWFLGNHTTKNGAQTGPSAPFLDCAGLFSFPCNTNSFGTLPEYKTRTRFTYNSGPLALSLQWRWIDGMVSACDTHCPGLFGLQPGELMLAVPEVDSEQYFALSFDYEINDTVSLYGGIKNLANNDPPWLGFFFIQANTDPSIYDVYGRRYYLGATARFGQ